jgi:hypothetical protein
MRRSTFEGRVAVARFGCPARAEVSEAALRQLRLANWLWNDLVAIERGHEEAIAAIWAVHPEVAGAQEAAAAAEAEAAEIAEAVGRARREGRARAAAPADLRQRLREARQRLRDARVGLREVKASLYDEIEPRFVEERAEVRRATKATYARWVQDGGLYWGTYNRVRAHFDTARARMLQQRVAGGPSALRFHPFDGEGTWTVQLQREAGDPERTWAVLAGGDSRWRSVIEVDDVPEPEAWSALSRGERRRAARCTVAIRIGREENGAAGGAAEVATIAGGLPGADGAREDRGDDGAVARVGERPVNRSARPVWLRLPVTIHRPLPVDADITQVEVTRRRVGTHFRLTVAMTYRTSAPVGEERGGLVAVDLGWRRRDDGSVRAAVWRGRGGRSLTAMPAWMSAWVRPGVGPESGEVVVPASWLEEDERLHQITGTRDRKFIAMRDRVAGWLVGHADVWPRLGPVAQEVVRSARGQTPYTDEEAVAALVETAPMWRSPARLGRLAMAWTKWAGDAGEEMAAPLEVWRRQDRHLSEWVAQTRDQLGQRRREVYRTLAARLVEAYGSVVVEELFLAAVERRPRVEDVGDPQMDAARRLSRAAAPGTLRAAVVSAAKREGASVLTVPAEGTTRVHAACGTWLDADFASEVTVWCPVCEMRFDQDFNAAANLLRLATGEVADLGRAGGQPSA